MFRVLLAYDDNNTELLLKKRFEQEGFCVVEDLDSIELEPKPDIIITEAELTWVDELNIPIIKIGKEPVNLSGSAKVAYLNKPFRPSELIAKARLLIEISQKDVRKTA